MIRLATLLSMFFALGLSSSASAQYFDDQSAGLVDDFESPETWAFELRGGPYQPDAGAAFDQFFADDNGPLLGLEIDFLFLELHDWFDVGIGYSFSWAQYVGFSNDEEGNRTEEETTLTLYPMPVVAVLRVDALARQLRIPILITGKLGADFVAWNTGTGGVSEATNMSIGLRWGVQFAFELDIFNQRAARSLDENWGINHSFVFFELFGSTASTTLEAGPKGGVAWAAGLGFIL